uniref:Major facilitator superfamily (MFS) profile domain-containing protein n=1 Tax=Pavo cristatus TaxID=9049 RepID=A0A8C9FKE7_PAVCR
DTFSHLQLSGEFGPFQRRLVLFSLPPCLSLAFHQFCQLFMVVDVPHYCNTDWIRAVGPNLTEEEQLNLTLPRDPSLLQEKISAVIFFLCRFGRRPVLLISILLEGLFGVGIALVPHFYVYLAFRCVVGASVSGIMMTLLALATEWVGVSYRPQAVLLSHCCFAAGQMILAGLSYGIPNWRLLQIVGSIYQSLLWQSCGTGWFHVPWKSQGMVKMSEEINVVFTHSCSICLVLLCSDFRFVNSLVYYGLSLNVTNFGLDIYLTQLAFGAVEIPGRVGCIFMLQWFGRKKSQGGFLLLSGLVCLLLTVIPEDQPVVITVLATIGKFTASASFSSAYVYTAELFPTIIRQSGVGLCSMVARVAGIIAPLILLLEQYHRVIPMAIYGGTTVLGGLLCFLLPETRGIELADGTEGGQPTAVVSDWQPPCCLLLVRR